MQVPVLKMHSCMGTAESLQTHEYGRVCFGEGCHAHVEVHVPDAARLRHDERAQHAWRQLRVDRILKIPDVHHLHTPVMLRNTFSASTSSGSMAWQNRLAHPLCTRDHCNTIKDTAHPGRLENQRSTAAASNCFSDSRFTIASSSCACRSQAASRLLPSPTWQQGLEQE